MTASNLALDLPSRSATAPEDGRPNQGGPDARGPDGGRPDGGGLDEGELNEAARVRLGANIATPAEVLLRFALDPSVTVRAALALNPAAPPAALGALARDADDRVRALLARKLAMLVPCLTETEQSRLNQQIVAALAHLIADTAALVRAAIAEVVKDMPTAPHALVLRLARDTAIEVSEPVIRLSPLLTQADLVELLAANAPAVALAVARRPDLAEAVADALAETAGDEAIQAMLLNHSAQIRESTLDGLIARAAGHVGWHAPLVRRPRLSPHAAVALSRIVADTLLGELAGRADLPDAVTAELHARLTARLLPPRDTQSSAATSGAATARTDAATPKEAATPSSALSDARAHAAAGRLTETELLGVAGRGEARLAAAMLAVAADVPLALVERVATLRSAKGVVSLVWKAGFSMRLAIPLQILLGRLGRDGLLAPGPGGEFPLATEEMRWQLEFLGRGGPVGST